MINYINWMLYVMDSVALALLAYFFAKQKQKETSSATRFTKFFIKYLWVVAIIIFIIHIFFDFLL